MKQLTTIFIAAILLASCTKERPPYWSCKIVVNKYIIVGHGDGYQTPAGNINERFFLVTDQPDSIREVNRITYDQTNVGQMLCGQ